MLEHLKFLLSGQYVRSYIYDIKNAKDGVKWCFARCINLVISDPMPGLKQPLRVRVGEGERTFRDISSEILLNFPTGWYLKQCLVMQ